MVYSKALGYIQAFGRYVRSVKPALQLGGEVA